jgi:TonB-dependent Receptor Plug Domain
LSAAARWRASALLVAFAALPARAASDAGSDATPNLSADAADGARDAGADTRDADDAPSAQTFPVPPSPPRSQPPFVAFRGRVLERGSRRPLAGVDIKLDATPAGTTDGEGRFELAAAPGSHRLEIGLPGQATLHVRIEAGAGRPEQMFRMTPALSGEHHETVVHAGRPEIAKITLSGDESRQTAGTSGDPIRVIGSLPGVIQIAWPAALYVVRGANPGNTGFFLDGIRVPALFHIALGPSVIHPYLIDGVDFYPGGYPVSYGPYVSGIMAARTVAPPADRVHASVDVTFFDAGGIVTAPWDGGRGTVAIAGRYSYTGELFSLLQTGTTLRYGDYQVRVDHPLAGGQATLFAFGSVDDLGWTNPGDVAMEYGSLQFHRLDLRWRRALAGGRLLIGATVGADWTQSTLFNSPIKVRAGSASPRLVYDRPLGGWAELEIGANADAQTFSTEKPTFEQKQGDLGSSRRAFSQALFGTVSFQLGSRLRVAPGLRGDLFAEENTEVFFLEPRLDVLYKLSDAIALKADGGRFAQMPSLPVSVPGFEAFGLADLGAQTSIGGSLGVEARLPRSFTLGVTAYYEKLRLTDVRNIDLMNIQPTEADFLVTRLGRTYGAELLLRRANEGRLFGWLAYTLSWSLRADDSGVYGRSDWDERHVLNLVAGYRLRGGYTVGARFHLNTGRWSPIIGSNGDYQQLPSYYQIDLRAERYFVFDRFTLDLYADVANATYDPEVLQLSAERPPSGQLVDINEGRVLLVLPTIGLHAQF